MKLDCQLCQLEQDLLRSVSTKSKLELRRHALGPRTLWCCYLENDLIGQVGVREAETLQQELSNAGLTSLPDNTALPVDVAIRSIKRDPQSGEVTALQVRFVQAKDWKWEVGVYQASKVENELFMSPELEDLEKDGRVVTRAQYEAIAANAAIQEQVRQDELQLLIEAVDKAPSRDAALAKALDNPRFAQFCDQLLDIVSPAVS